MNIYQKEFQPTYLYIKQHSVTKLLYLGKTTGTEVFLLEHYKGGGSHWTRHIKKHGKEFVETIWYCLFTEKDELVKFALMCSEQWDIVKSKGWANIKPENGLDGGAYGIVSDETRLKRSASLSGKKKPTVSVKMKGNSHAKANKGIPKSEEHKTAASVTQKNKAKIVCEHCNRAIGGQANFNRYHGNNCKTK